MPCELLALRIAILPDTFVYASSVLMKQERGAQSSERGNDAPVGKPTNRSTTAVVQVKPTMPIRSF